MSNTTKDIAARPCEADARRIIATYLGPAHFTLRRFPTGLCHYVYEVTTESSTQFVLRMGYGDTRELLVGSVYWTEKLLPLGVRIPKILFSDLTAPFPYTILERIPGVDLGDVYPRLAAAEKKAIAQEIVQAQKLVQGLPVGPGFGYAHSYNDTNLKRSWYEVIQGEVDRARDWIVTHGVCDPRHVDRVESALAPLTPYFNSVSATPFLHDTTTKNVLIDKQRFSGIVDIDDLSFGDPLFVIALTQMGLLSQECDTDYIDFWCEELCLSNEQRRIISFYTALFCVTFMGELGQLFNKDSVAVNINEVARLEKILNALLGERTANG